MVGTQSPLMREVQNVTNNQMNSAEWCASIESFDLLRLAAGDEVLRVVDEVRHQQLNHVELAALLRARAGR